MICPLRGTDCHKTNCAWWRMKSAKCIMQTISELVDCLDGIDDSLTRIKEIQNEQNRR